MKQLVEILEGFFGNVGVDMTSMLSDVFSISTIQDYKKSSPLDKLRYIKDKTALLESLPVGSVIKIETISKHDFACRRYYIQKCSSTEYRMKDESEWKKGRYGAKYGPNDALMSMLRDLGELLYFGTDLTTKTSITK